MRAFSIILLMVCFSVFADNKDLYLECDVNISGEIGKDDPITKSIAKKINTKSTAFISIDTDYIDTQMPKVGNSRANISFTDLMLKVNFGTPCWIRESSIDCAYEGEGLDKTMGIVSSTQVLYLNRVTGYVTYELVHSESFLPSEYQNIVATGVCKKISSMKKF